MDRYLTLAQEAIDRTAGGLTTAALASPVDGKWSIAQILEHLTLAFTANAAAMEKALASGTLRARTPTVPQRLARVIVLELGYFPRVNAPQATVPSGSIPPDRSVDAILEGLTRVDRSLTAVAERFGEQAAVMNHPYFAGLSVPQWRKFHWRHTLHHMRQVRARGSGHVVALCRASPHWVC